MKDVSFLTPSTAAKLLGVTRWTIENWVDKGYLRSYRTAGGHRRIYPQDVDKMLGESALLLEKYKNGP
jgi:excisionase family DNA binding protein